MSQPALKKATLIKRYKRFLADVILEDGSETTIHIANTGAMTGCATPNDTVWYSTSDNPKRKYPYSWELTQTQSDNHFICVNTAQANNLVETAIVEGTIVELQGYASLKREVKYGDENSKIDIFLSNNDANKPDAFVEVKSVTLLQDGHGYFPDAVTTRGQKHLRELASMVQQGKRAVLVFAVLHTGINDFAPAAHIDAKYSELLAQVIKQGVEVLGYKAEVSPTTLTLVKPLTLNI